MVADASGWAYAIVFLFAFLDALVPIVPSETAVITAGVVAASGDLSLALIIPSAAAGAFLGDNTVYLIGRRFGGRATERFFRGEKARRRMDWADEQLRERGGEVGRSQCRTTRVWPIAYAACSPMNATSPNRRCSAGLPSSSAATWLLE